MKLVLVISSIFKSNPGIGGHYFSMLETAKQLYKEHEVTIVNIGTKKAIALQDTGFTIHYITVTGAKIIKIHYAFKKLLKEINPDFIQAFDVNAYFWCRSVGNVLNIPHGFTKCGGINPKYLPYTRHLVLFSEENMQHVKSIEKFHSTNTFLIPNRLVSFENDEKRIAKLNETLGGFQNEFKFLRISRIKPYYKKSAEQIINLVNWLNSEGVDCVLIFVGTIEDQDTFEYLKDISGPKIWFFTESEFTENAKQLIDVSDAVLGAGRSFMEAASKGKVLLCPLKNEDFPLLITEKNYSEAFRYNFSERVEINNFDKDFNLNRIKTIITNKELSEKYGDLATELFKKDFDANKLCDKYNKVFKKAKKSDYKEKYLDLILHGLYLLRRYIVQ